MNDFQVPATASSGVVTFLFNHDNTLLRQELGRHGDIASLNAHRT